MEPIDGVHVAPAFLDETPIGDPPDDDDFDDDEEDEEDDEEPLQAVRS